jgi:hypothetical protein
MEWNNERSVLNSANGNMNIIFHLAKRFKISIIQKGRKGRKGWKNGTSS